MLLEIHLELYNLACRKWGCWRLFCPQLNKKGTHTDTLMYTAPSVIWAEIIQANRTRCAMVKDLSFFGGCQWEPSWTHLSMVWTQGDDGYTLVTPIMNPSFVRLKGKQCPHSLVLVYSRAYIALPHTFWSFFPPKIGQTKIRTEWIHNIQKHHRDWPVAITCHNHLNSFELLEFRRKKRTAPAFGHV
jgi:hypothetical protein